MTSLAPCLISLFTISAPTNSHQSSVSYCHKPGSKTFSLANHSGADNLVNQSQLRVNTCTCAEKNVKLLVWPITVVQTIAWTNQNNRHFTVFLPSQCWCARFGELTAINNIGRTRRRARSRKSVEWKAPIYFCLRLKLGLLWVHHLKEMSTMAWRTNTAGYHLHTYGY